MILCPDPGGYQDYGNCIFCHQPACRQAGQAGTQKHQILYSFGLILLVHFGVLVLWWQFFFSHRYPDNPNSHWDHKVKEFKFKRYRRLII